VPQGWFYAQKFGDGSWVEARKLAFFISCRTSQPCATADRLGTALGTKHAIGVHTGAGGQCTDTIETGIGADGRVYILHTGVGSEGLEQVICGMGLPM